MSGRFDELPPGGMGGVRIYDPPMPTERVRGPGSLEVIGSRYMPDALSDAFKAIWLQPMRGIERVYVMCDRHDVVVMVQMGVFDRDSMMPISITFRYATPMEMLTHERGPLDEAVERLMQRALHEAVMHEVNEIIRSRGGKRPFDPHA